MTKKKLTFELTTIDNGIRLYKSSRPFKTLPPSNYRYMSEEKDKNKKFLELSRYLMLKGFNYLAIVDQNNLRLAYPVILKDSKRANPQYILLNNKSIGGSNKFEETMSYSNILKQVIAINEPSNKLV